MGKALWQEGAGSTSERTTSPQPKHHRLDIQGMRALAVGIVVIYHVWPTVLPGGFVGVDVFFVISGYLIISSLTRELNRTGTVGLLAFYSRRVRRLLPAATVVVLATTAAAFLLLPDSQLRRNLGDAVASSLQVANWRFAFGPDSYAQATAGVSPFQHFWSLAIEEQFYIVIPIVLLLIGLAIRRMRVTVNGLVVTVLSVLAAASLVWSIVQTSTNPSIAYFSTFTRAWELLLGGVVALLLARVTITRTLSVVAGIAGLILVLIPAALYSTALPFPGALALVPVAGTLLLLAAGSTAERGPVTLLLQTRPLTWVGDISYSLYLWHWPLIVVVLALSGPTLGVLDGPVVIVASLVIAGLSERFVERPFRAGRTQGRPAKARRQQRRDLLVGITTAAVAAATALVPLQVINAQIASAVDAEASSHPGAGVFDGAVAPAGQPVLPDPRVAHEDTSVANLDHCIENDLTRPDPRRAASMCRYGPAGAEHRVVLVGDSHAAVLSTPLARLADEEGFALTALLRNGCPFTLSAPDALEDCEAQNQRSLDVILADPPDVVVIQSMTPYGYEKALGWTWPSFEDAVSGYTETMRPLVDAGIAVVVVRDNPYLPFSAPDCVADAGQSEAGSCDLERSQLTEQRDALAEAAAGLPGASVVDLTDKICRAETCEAVEGNVLVYRDNHLTQTYARTLAPALRPVMVWDSATA